MKAKNTVYAAVGAPIVVARALNARLESLRDELETRTEGLSDRAQQILDEWTEEGRHAMEKVSDGKMVDEFAAKVDFDQAREQVGKLRDQLEEMLATWRASFRPETGEEIPVPSTAASKAETAKTEKAGAAAAASSKAGTTVAKSQTGSKSTAAESQAKPGGTQDPTRSSDSGSEAKESDKTA